MTGIGSSDAPVIMNGEHFSRNRHDLWSEKLGKVLPRTFTSFQNQRMRRGQILEPDARYWYANFMGVEVQPVCCTHACFDWIKGSLDGWVAKSRTVLEIKAPNEKDHQTALEQRVPQKYIPQVMHLLLVTGAQHLHYLSYSPNRPKQERFALVSVLPDSGTLRQLLKKEEIFWNCLVNEIPPEDHLFF
jgi:putative phage-type endonuclease